MERESYEIWKERLNQKIISELGMTADDLPFMSYRDMYEVEINTDIAYLIIAETLDVLAY